MKIIGIHNTGVTSSAALLINGKLICAFPEERLTRNKYDKYFPVTSIKRCLKYAKLKISEIDYFAIGWNPAKNLHQRIRPGHYEWVNHPGLRFASNPNYLLTMMGIKNEDFEDTVQEFNIGKKNISKKIIYVDHHSAHIANSYYSSGFLDSIVLSLDGYGENSAIVSAYASKNGINKISEQLFPHSLGEFYSTITQFLGFKPYAHEWKVMGMAGYGKPNRYFNKMKKLIEFDNLNFFKLNLNYFDFYNFDNKFRFSKDFISLFGNPRNEKDSIKAKHFDIAAAAQKITEEILFDILKKIKSKSKSKNICLSGGVIMNSVMNGKIYKSGIFKNIFIPFSPDDTGNSIGAALYVHKKFAKKNMQVKSLQNPFLGDQYSEKNIKSMLEKNKISYIKVDNICKKTAELISDGNVIGWFQGREEFGQRALGNRSIIADPRSKKMKDYINLIIKNRENFRPFAPSILSEFIDEYFETDSKCKSNYMEKTFKFKNKVLKKIPAVVHIDNTGRVQTVNKELSPLYYSLISEFNKITKIPLVLNTSFNIDGEPIVSSPRDAIRTFFSSGIDVLVLGKFIVRKKN